MGSIFSLAKSRKQSNTASSRSPGTTSITRASSSSYRRQTQTPGSRNNSFTSLRQTPSSNSGSRSKMASSSVGKTEEAEKKKKKTTAKNKYQYIPDNFTSLDQITAALRESGLESSNLIIGIDFTKSNEWTGKVSFNNRSLHTIGDQPNPYEKAISIIGKTLAPLDEDNLIPCFGFGDVVTHDQQVFSFHPDHSPCHGFEEVLACYRNIVSNLKFSGPTSYGPVIDAAIDMVEKSAGQFHVLVIIADGQVTRSVNTRDTELSPQEERTISSIVDASIYPLSIVLVGVGDGPWEDMKNFDDRIPARQFDNFQFVNFTAIMSTYRTDSEKETRFALAALMEIPIQYQAAKEFGLLGHVTGKAKKVVPQPPPIPYMHRHPNSLSAPTHNEETQACPVCLTSMKDMAFGCGHTTCRECGAMVSDCPICRQRITSRIRLYV